jgi:uncharacterized phage protein (TIGR02220 family)
MARDPAFLFYDADAAKDVSHMNRLERGCYFDLIQAQRKFGSFTVEQAKKILSHDFESCWPSLELILTIEKERYCVEWVKDSIEKRKEYSEIQRKRIQDYWDNKKSIPRNNGGISTDIPLEIENEIVIVIEYLNKVSGKKFSEKSKPTIKHIKARLAEKFTIEQFKHVIDIKCDEWMKDIKMSKYVRPETLFGTKFESYLNEKPIIIKTNSSTNKLELNPLWDRQ